MSNQLKMADIPAICRGPFVPRDRTGWECIVRRLPDVCNGRQQ